MHSIFDLERSRNRDMIWIYDPGVMSPRAALINWFDGHLFLVSDEHGTATEVMRLMMDVYSLALQVIYSYLE